MTPKTRLSPSAKSASKPASRMPFSIASRKKMSSWQSIPSQPHIGPAHLVAGEERRGWPARLDAPDLEKVGAVDDLQHLGDVLLDDQYRVALGADAAHELEDLRHDDRRQAHRGLVEEDELRPAHQRAGDGAHLLLAARHRAGELVAALLEAREQAVDVGEALGEPLARRRDEGAHLEVAFDGQAREQAPALGHMGDAGLDDPVRS